ncbi:FecR family protein [Nonlabens antarcticus]|uniref:FecR family protein n=1 Tax=Nonlabens antarcticus TaxID=392714 RepID=UPI001890BFB4|nr:FecR domain-containing protein [Nonlabens antarcticus]
MNKQEAKSLFSKYIDGTCKDRETQLLEAFLKSYQPRDGKNPVKEFDRMDQSTVKVWQEVLNSIEKEEAVEKKPIFKWSYLAAAAAVAILIFGSMFLFTTDGAVDSENLIVDTPINAGTDKAILTLDTGEEITLEKGSTYSNSNVNSTGNSLVYDDGASKDSETISYNFLTIPRGGQYYVVLGDHTKVWLNSETKLKYPQNFVDGQPRVVELVYGEAFFDVSPSEEHNGQHFKVLARNQTIDVLGTEFNVKAYQDEKKTLTTLAEGKIELATQNKTVTLKPGQQAIVASDAGGISLNEVNIYDEVSWKEGIFSFRGKTLTELAMVLSRWYDVQFVFEKPSLKNATFKGVLSKDQSIKEILDVLTEASEIQSYQIKRNTIYIK